MRKTSELNARGTAVCTGGKVRLREKKLDDARNDYAWCRDIELSRLDAALPLNMSYSQYVSEYIGELRYPSSTRRRLAIETLGGEHIGNCSYYNIDLDRAETEIGIMIGNQDYWGKGYGTDTINTLVKYVFQQTKFKRLYLKTLDWNLRAQHCFRKCGFHEYNFLPRDGYRFMMMELTREEWLKTQAQVDRKKVAPLLPA